MNVPVRPPLAAALLLSWGLGCDSASTPVALPVDISPTYHPRCEEAEDPEALGCWRPTQGELDAIQDRIVVFATDIECAEVRDMAQSLLDGGNFWVYDDTQNRDWAWSFGNGTTDLEESNFSDHVELGRTLAHEAYHHIEFRDHGTMDDEPGASAAEACAPAV